MTLSEFRAKYRLQQRLTQRGVASYHAVDSSGRVVMVHSLDSASHEEVDQVRGMIHRLNAADRKHILEILDVEGAPVIVTEYLQAFQSLSQWLEVRTRGDATDPAVTPAPAKTPPRGEFTQFFGPADPPKTPIVETPEPAAAPTGGEFTRLFGAIKEEPVSAPPPPSPPPAPPPSPPPAAKPAGDFTRLFGAGTGKPAMPATPTEAPAPPPPPVAPPPVEKPKIVVRWREAAEPEPSPAADKPLIRWKKAGEDRKPAAKEPGDFTRLFGPQGGDPASAPPPEPLEPPAPPQSNVPARQGVAKEGFTQLLRAAADSPGEPANSPDVSDTPPIPAPPSKPAPGAFTSLMSGLPTPGAAALGSAAQPAAPGPSEFTRMMSAMPAPSRAAPAPPPAEEEDDEQRPSMAKLFIALGVILLLAVALIVVFAIKK